MTAENIKPNDLAPKGRRHNWPRKDEVYRLYRERDGSYLIVIVDDLSPPGFGAIANALSGPNPSLCYTTVSRQYIFEAGLKRVQFSEIPEEWQQAIRNYLSNDPPERPDGIRGFWTMGNQPKPELTL